MTPRDVAQYLEGFLGEDSAVYKAVEYAGPFVESFPSRTGCCFL